MTVKQQLKTRWLSFMKHGFNRVIMKSAGSAHSIFSVVYHVGRKSGKRYETPVIVRRVGDSFVFALTYGPDVDWYRNVVAADGCTLRWQGSEYALKHVESVDVNTGVSAFPKLLQPISRVNGTKHFVRIATA